MEDENKVYNNIIGAKNKIKPKWLKGSGSSLQLAEDLLRELAGAAQKGKFSDEQIKYFSETPRWTILSDLYKKARETLIKHSLERGLERYGVAISDVRNRTGRYVEMIEKQKIVSEVYRSALDEMLSQYGVAKEQPKPAQAMHPVFARRQFWKDYGGK